MGLSFPLTPKDLARLLAVTLARLRGFGGYEKGKLLEFH